MGVTALVWLITLFFGLTLSWPKNGSKLESWISLFNIRWGSGNYKINYDLHQASSLLVFPFLAIIAFTAVYLGLPDLVKPVINSVSPLTSPPHIAAEIQADKIVRVVNADEAILAVQKQFPQALVSSLNRDYKKKRIYHQVLFAGRCFEKWK